MIPDMRTTYLPRETGEEASMRFSVRVLFFLGFAVFFTIIFASSCLLAQSQTAKISGMVTDPHGAAIVGAHVTAEPVSPGNMAEHSVSANDGQFSLMIAPGKYRLMIARDSFATTQQEVNLTAGESREVDFRLELEPLSSKVVVTAQALPLDADSSPAPLTILTRDQIDAVFFGDATWLKPRAHRSRGRIGLPVP
jgi:hypothetical protein